MSPANQPDTNPHAPEPLQPIAGLLAVLFPGLGHLYLGYRRRAILIAAGVLGLFASGLFIGGIDAVDRRENFVWFIGQGLVGPLAFGVDWVHQNVFKVSTGPTGPRAARPDETKDPASGMPVATRPDPLSRRPIATVNGVVIDPAYPPYTMSLARMSELGTLFCTIAGMINLIAVIDAGSRHRNNDRAGRGGGGSAA